MIRKPDPILRIRRSQLRKIVKSLVIAEILESWKGGGDPDDWDDISANLRRARRDFKALLNGEVKP